MKDKDRFVDELLDSALLHHRAAQPRPGLEARILERVRATAGEELAAAKTWKLWIAAAATVAVVMMFVAIRVARRPYSPTVQTSKANKAVPAPAPKEILAAKSGTAPNAGRGAYVIEPKRIAHRESNPARRVEAHHWPSQFPTPAPLTEEQQALVQYVRETPPQVLDEPILKAELTVQRVEIKPLKIPPLEIRPLALGLGREEMQ